MGPSLPSVTENQGTSRRSRLNKALEPGHFQLDERTAADFLRFIQQLAAHLIHHDSEGGNTEDWRPFFARDEAFLLAEIAGLDLAALEREKLDILQSLEGYDGIQARAGQFVRFFRFCLERLKTLDDWYRRASGANRGLHPTPLENELEAAITGEGSRLLSRLMAYDMARAGSQLPILMELDYTGFSPLWSVEETEPVSIYDRGENELVQLNHAVRELILLYPPIINIITGLNQKAPGLFYKSYYGSDDHLPHNGLLFTFLELYEVVKSDLNELTHKHLHFFYRDILGQKPRPGKADTFFLSGILSAGIQEATIDKGLLVRAGQNALGHPELYAIDYGIQLSHIRPTMLLTLYLSRNPLVDAYSRFRLVSGIYSCQTANPQQPGLYPCLGEEQLFLSGEERTMQDVNLGFALSSPVLRLSGGIRQITMAITFTAESMDKLTYLLVDIAENRKRRPEEIFHEIFSQAFSLSYTGPEGWVQVVAYHITAPEDWSKDAIIISFELGEAAPAVIPWIDEIHGRAYDAKQPVLELLVSGNPANHPYSFLENMSLQSIDLSVRVESLRNVKCYNHLGAIDPATPFPLLGPVPGLGSYFLLGCAELFSKDLTNLQVDLDYMPLALDGGTFSEHYKAYPQHIDATSFQVNLSALSQFRYAPVKEETRQSFPLFPADTQEVGVRKITFSGIDLAGLQIQPDYELSEEAVTMQGKHPEAGYLKFTLCNPPMGFGFEWYPKLFVETVTENAKPNSLLSGEKPMRPIPANPVFPVVSSVRVSYQAKSRLQFDERRLFENDSLKGEMFFHLHPFGKEKVFDAGRPSRKEILPGYPEEGYFHIGLEDVRPPQQLHLLLHMCRSEQWEIGHIPEVRWQYHTGEDWKDFETANLLNDGTRHLMVTGICSFLLPTDMRPCPSLMPGNRHWIRVSARQKADLHSRLLAVYTNATTATYQFSEHTFEHPVVLPAGSARELAEPVEGITEILQPLDSFHGAPAEIEAVFHARIAESIRHKNRCLTRWDVERMLLDRFDSLNQVRCIGHQGYEQNVEQGALVIVAIPRVYGEKQFFEPKLSPELIGEMRDFLERSCSPFVRLEIRNPSYEYLRLKASILFEGKSPGRYIRQLQQDLLHFLCPWFYDDDVEAALGGSIRKSALAQFVENRPYVRFLTGLSIIQLQVSDNGIYMLKDTASDSASTDSLLQGGTPWSVLIPSFSNDITVLEKPVFRAPEPANLSDFRIGQTLVIGSDQEKEPVVEVPDNNPTVGKSAADVPTTFTLTFG